MSYIDHFVHADSIITHLNSIVPNLSDPLLGVKYLGFISVSAVTVYELAIKTIFIEFAQNKHKILGNFTTSYFQRINGRIKIEVIKNDYIKRFGDRYLTRFQKKLDIKEKEYLKTYHRNIKSSYSNLITWRNDFAHEGKFNSTATYDEVVQAYEDGKEVIHCLAASMKR